MGIPCEKMDSRRFQMNFPVDRPCGKGIPNGMEWDGWEPRHQVRALDSGQLFRVKKVEMLGSGGLAATVWHGGIMRNQSIMQYLLPEIIRFVP